MKKALVIFFLVNVNTLCAQQVYITITANGYVRINTIVEATLEKPLSPKFVYDLIDVKSKNLVPVQQTEAKRILFILPQTMQPGDSATYRLSKSVRRKDKSPVTVEKQAKGLLVKVQDRKVLFYNTSIISPPDTMPTFYARSGFIHPLYSPSGKVLTDDFPIGHAHQHGVMMAWVNTTFRGLNADFWNQHQQTGNIKHVRVEAISTGPVAAILKLRLQHYTNSYGEVLSELWTITVYPFQKHFLFDIASVQQNITNDTLFLNKNMYGGVAFRGSSQWNDADSLNYKSKWNIETDSGFNLSNANGRRAAYVSASGLVDGAISGLSIYSFPGNYNYPQPVRIHPVMPYWCFAPAATGPFTIAPGQAYMARYRYCTVDGPPDKLILQNINNDLVHPVGVTVSYK